jgi:hypothetical protein
MLTKMVQRLPHNVREPVTSILTMAFDTSAQSQQKIENQNLELITVRGELKKKGVQMEQLNNSCDIYRERLKVMEEKLRSLSDDIDSRQKITTQNKRHMARMSATNRMLINSLEALNEEVPDAGIISPSLPPPLPHGHHRCMRPTHLAPGAQPLILTSMPSHPHPHFPTPDLFPRAPAVVQARSHLSAWMAETVSTSRGRVWPWCLRTAQKRAATRRWRW